MAGEGLNISDNMNQAGVLVKQGFSVVRHYQRRSEEISQDKNF
jgi:hypothetical protein